MKPKRALSSYILLVGILALSIVGGVIAYQIFSALTKSQVSTEQDILIKPLDGAIDPKIVEELKQRKTIPASLMQAQISYSGGSTQSGLLNQTSTPSISKIASESGGGF